MAALLANPKIPFTMRATTEYWSFMTMVSAAMRWDRDTYDVESVVDDGHRVAFGGYPEEGKDLANLIVAIRICLWTKGLSESRMPVPERLAEMRKEVLSERFARYTPDEVEELNEEFNEETNTIFTLCEEEADGTED